MTFEELAQLHPSQKATLLAQKEGWQKVEPGYPQSADMDWRRPTGFPPGVGGRDDTKDRRPIPDYGGDINTIFALVLARARRNPLWYVFYAKHLESLCARRNSQPGSLSLKSSEADAEQRMDACLLADAEDLTMK